MSETLDDFIFIYYENFRSRAYAQVLSENGFFPKKVIKLGDEFKTDLFLKYSKVLLPYCTTEFNPQVSVSSTFAKYGLDVEEIKIADINSSKFIKILEKISSKYAIYSGKAGVLVSDELLDVCEGFLHIHGGYLPHYRGSTTFYYSILDEFKIGASAIFLNSEIDEGKIIYKDKFTPSKRINVDYIQDPMARANVLIGALKNLLNNDVSKISLEQDKTIGNTYRVIHPVLKNISLKRLDL